jgi:hypothetical protein
VPFEIAQRALGRVAVDLDAAVSEVRVSAV